MPIFGAKFEVIFWRGTDMAERPAAASA